MGNAGNGHAGQQSGDTRLTRGGQILDGFGAAAGAQQSARNANIELGTAAEAAICRAIVEVEKLGPDWLLAEALISTLRDLLAMVGDFQDVEARHAEQIVSAFRASKSGAAAARHQ
jgi:hypothetical protein